MFNVSKRVDEFTEELKKTIYSESKEINPVILAVKNKKKYFEEKDFLWDTETMFRLWKKIYINLMKKDGFETYVNEYYKKDRKKHERRSAEDISKRLNVGHQFGDSLNKFKNKRGMVPPPPKGRSGQSRVYTKQQYQVEKELVQQVQREIEYWQANKSTHDVENVLNGIESVIRGRSIKNDETFRDLVDTISSSLGVFIHNNDYGYSIVNDPNTQKNVYLSLLQTCKICNATGENIFDIIKSNIGFISVHEIDIYHPYNFTRRHSVSLRGELFNGEQLTYRLTREGISSMFVSVSNNDHYKNEIHYEFIRRVCKNRHLLNELGLRDGYDLAKLKKNDIL